MGRYADFSITFTLSHSSTMVLTFTIDDINCVYKSLLRFVESNSNKSITVPDHDDISMFFCVDDITFDFDDFVSLYSDSSCDIDLSTFIDHVKSHIDNKFTPDLHSWRQFTSYLSDYNIITDNDGHSHIHHSIFEFIFGKCRRYNYSDIEFCDIDYIISDILNAYNYDGYKVVCNIEGEFS